MDYGKTSFDQDLITGNLGEHIFVEEFLKKNGMTYFDVSGDHTDHDFLTVCGISGMKWEVKATWHDTDTVLRIEEKNDLAKDGSCFFRPGWGYTCNADNLVFVDTDTKKMLIIPSWPKIRQHIWTNLSGELTHKNNRPSTRSDGSTWQGGYVELPLSAIAGYYYIVG